MKRTIAKLAAATLSAVTLIGAPSVMAQTPPWTGVSIPVDMEKEIADQLEREKNAVDPTDPVVIARMWKYAPNNPANLPPPKNAEEEALYAQRIKDHEENLAKALRKKGIEISVQEFEKLYSGNAETPAPPKARLRFFSDEARTEELPSLADVAVGDTVYYKLWTDKRYVCTNIDINCPLTVKNHSIYADIPGTEIEIKLTTALVGDINGDGAVNVKDVLAYMKELITPKPYNYEHILNSDLNCDEKYNARDIATLMRYILDPSVDICHHSEYNVNTHLRTYVISTKPEGSDWVDNTQLPEPFPVIDEPVVNPDDLPIKPFWGQNYGYIMRNNKYVTVDLMGYVVNPGGSGFWDNYLVSEIHIPIAKGETNPELIITDSSSVEKDSDSYLCLNYTIPDGAETVETAVRIAFTGMRELYPNHHND